jgi:hypothetical protein
MLGKEVCPSLGELRECAAVMQFKPAERNRAVEPAAYSSGVPLSPNRNGPLSFSI